MTTVELEICTGTACYLLGGADLLLLAQQLPDDLRDRVRVRGRTCMDHCRRPACGKTPFVRIDGVPVGDATPETVRELLRQQLAGKG